MYPIVGLHQCLNRSPQQQGFKLMNNLRYFKWLTPKSTKLDPKGRKPEHHPAQLEDSQGFAAYCLRKNPTPK